MSMPEEFELGERERESDRADSGTVTRGSTTADPNPNPNPNRGSGNAAHTDQQKNSEKEKGKEKGYVEVQIDTASPSHNSNLNYKEGPEGTILITSVEDVREPSLDPRLSLDSKGSRGRGRRPRAEDLDGGLGLGRRISRIVHGHGRGHGRSGEGKDEEDVGGNDEEIVYIQFEENDRRNPINFPRSKKWAITLLSCFSTLIASSTGSIYNSGFESMTRDLNCTTFQATIGLSLYALGFGIVPLVTASFSEEVGRQPLYVVSATGVLLMYVMIALAHNIQTVLIGRFLQGSFGSTWATMVGGTISDIWVPAERGLPMSIFTLAAIGGTGLGPVYAGWIEMNPRLEWRWIEWIEMMICALYLLLLPFIMRETRSSILLTKLAKRIRKETGDKRYRARVEDERTNVLRLIYVACTRPIHLLLTEPVVASFSLWVGFAWGILYCMIESIADVFAEVHGFNVGQIGTVFLAMVIGSLIGFGTNFIQEYLYQKYYPTRGPEARLYFACAAGILFPVGMFIYAWSTFEFVPWIVLAIGIGVFVYAVFIIYLAVFSYLADCYGPFASSALAGQSLCRNVSATAFPLFTQQMFQRLSFKWANTLFGCIACVMMPIPFVLFFYGPTIRARSKFSRIVMQNQQQK